MSLPAAKYAVYYGTITLNDGTLQTFTADEVATLYGVDQEDYLSVPLIGDTPFSGGVDELSYIHLKPLKDARYYDAKERYNVDNEIQYDEDFDSRRGGKWAVRPEFEHEDELG